MALDISEDIKQIEEASRGEDVRDAIVDALTNFKDGINAFDASKQDKIRVDNGDGTYSTISNYSDVTNSDGTIIDFSAHAYGKYSMAEGAGTTGRQDKIGDENFGRYAHAEGSSTATGINSHAEGNSTISSENGSHSEGSETTASGQGSHAEGFKSKATTIGTHAEGNTTIASANGAHAEGIQTTASGEASHAEGTTTEASGAYAFAGGNSAVASGKGSFAFGNPSLDDVPIKTTASGKGAIAFGQGTTASGNNSFTEGTATTASGNDSHAEGLATTASEDASHAEGNYAKASGNASHAEGVATIASGGQSHAEGHTTTASGFQSHSEGVNSIASGWISHVEGYYTNASGDCQHVSGEYNIVDSVPTDDEIAANPDLKDRGGHYAEIIGNGTDDDKRRNARTLDWSGNEILSGKLTLGAEGTEDNDAVTKKYVDANKGTTYKLELDGTTLKLSGSDGSVQSVDILSVVNDLQTQIKAQQEKIDYLEAKVKGLSVTTITPEGVVINPDVTIDENGIVTIPDSTIADDGVATL